MGGRLNTYIFGSNPARDAAVIADMCSGEVIGLDTETEGINPKTTAPASGAGRIACWSVSTPKFPRVFLWADTLPVFTHWIENPDYPKVGHNIYGFDKHMFHNSGIKLRGVIADTMRMSRLLYSSKMRSHGLKDLARNWLDISQPSFDSLFRRPKHKIEFIQEKKRGVEVQFRESYKKVGEHKRVPTTYASGMRGKFGKALDYIPLSSVPTDYPERLQALYDYASLDALLTRELYFKFRDALEKVEWKIAK